MRCPFCQQWNDEGEARCCFCQNRLDGDEDLTVEGRPRYEQRPSARLVAVQDDGARRLHAGQGRSRTLRLGSLELKVQLSQEQLIAVGVGLLLLLAFLFGRC